MSAPVFPSFRQADGRNPDAKQYRHSETDDSGVIELSDPFARRAVDRMGFGRAGADGKKRARYDSA